VPLALGAGRARHYTVSDRTDSKMSNYSLPLRPLEFFFAQYRRVWRGTIISSVVTPVVFLLAFGWGLGQVANDSLGLPAGVSYLEFVAPGLLAATSMQIASFEASWPVLSAIKWSRQYHAMLATPLRIGDVVLGHQAFIASRMLMTASIYFAVILAFGAVESPLGILAIFVAVLVGLAFAAPIAAWGAFTENEASFVAIFRFVILPMFLFSGTFFSVESLPRLFEALAYLTPLWHGVDLSRQLTLGEVDVTSAFLHVTYLVAFATAGLVAAHYTYRRRLSK
jgi:lipooligosaccharide transport system permease protein